MRNKKIVKPALEPLNFIHAEFTMHLSDVAQLPCNISLEKKQNVWNEKN